MANIYVRSTDGNNADNGSTWALAKATVAGAIAIASSGDTIYVSHVHAESQASALTWSVNSSVAFPIKIICVNDGAAPPTAQATTATVTTTGANGQIIGAGTGGLYIYGITFNVGSGASRADIEIGQPSAADLDVTCDSCVFSLVNTNTGSGIYPSAYNASSACRTTLINCQIKLGHADQDVRLSNSLRIVGGGYAAGTAAAVLALTPSLVTTPYVGGRCLVEGFDFSLGATALVLTTPPTYVKPSPYIFRNCKLPASWSGTLCGAGSNAARVEMYNCAAGAVNYALWVEEPGGSIRHETTIVRTGGASDGVTPLSWKIAASSNCGYLGTNLRTPEIAVYNTSTSAKTLTVEIIRDSLTNLTDKEIWLEVSYLGSSATPLATLITDAAAGEVTAAADQTASSETWTTTGLTNPNKQKLSVTLTPQMSGYFLCTVVVAKPSVTIYVCPKVTVA